MLRVLIFAHFYCKSKLRLVIYDCFQKRNCCQKSQVQICLQLIHYDGKNWYRGLHQFYHLYFPEIQQFLQYSQCSSIFLGSPTHLIYQHKRRYIYFNTQIGDQVLTAGELQSFKNWVAKNSTFLIEFYNRVIHKLRLH